MQTRFFSAMFIEDRIVNFSVADELNARLKTQRHVELFTRTILEQIIGRLKSYKEN